MRVRRLIDGDIATSGVIWLYDRDAVAQTISTRLKLFLGEYFRDICRAPAGALQISYRG